MAAGEGEADSLADDSSLEVLSGTFSEECLQGGFQRNVERRNLLNLTKLAVKSLIEASMSSGRTQDDGSFPLQQLFIVLEYVLKHRLKIKRSLIGQKRSFWGMIESYERTSSSFAESIMNTRSLVGVKTMQGRGRVWLRVSLMKKKLADHFLAITENRHILSEWYEEDSLMMGESVVVIAGLLMGLNVIDYTVTMKGEDFDRPGVLDLSLFLKDGNYLEKTVVEDGNHELSEEEQASQISKLMDQKAFLEELNRKLENQLEKVQTKLKSEEAASAALHEQLSSLIASVEEVTKERDRLSEEKARREEEMEKKLVSTQDDQKTELDTYIQTRAGLNDMYSASQKSLESEMKLRKQLEEELDLVKSLKEEKETALQLLEKSVHEKQDTVVTLRQQLEEMKAANLKVKSHLKSAKEAHQSDTLKIKNLEGHLAQMSTTNKQLDQRLRQSQVSLSESEKTSRELGQRLEEVQLAVNTAQTDLSVEKQWRQSLQAELQKEKERIVDLTNETKGMKSLKQEHAELKEKYAITQELVSEQEMALVEMGKKLSVSQQKIADMKDVDQLMKESIWKDDRDVLECQNCKKAFSVVVRKHHCRNCGGVFCGTCSDNAMQLASSAKPVRVCDGCYTLLLERSSR